MAAEDAEGEDNSLQRLGREGPSPLWRACARLVARLSSYAEDAEPPNREGFFRIELQVDELIHPAHWLVHQSIMPQLFAADERTGMLVAGVGVSEMVSETAPDEESRLAKQLDRWKEFSRRLGGKRARYYGAARIDSQTVHLDGAEWREFRDGIWLLPLVEVQVCDGVCLLACQLRWENGQEGVASGVARSFLQAVCRARDALQRICFSVEPIPGPVRERPILLGRSEAVRQLSSPRSMGTQRVRLELSQPAEPVFVAEWLMSNNGNVESGTLKPIVTRSVLLLRLSDDVSLLASASTEAVQPVPLDADGVPTNIAALSHVLTERHMAALDVLVASSIPNARLDTGLHNAVFGFMTGACCEVWCPTSTILFRRCQAFLYHAISPQENGALVEKHASESHLCSFFPKARRIDGTLAEELRMNAAENMNVLSAMLLLEELRRCDLCHVVLCPGSRSAPLAIALSRSGLPHTIALDERGAGFMAVGLARASGRAAAVIVSSGTAVVNLHPAAVEAGQDHVPMVLLTADRPPELRDTKANQTIDQVGLISGGVLRWFKDMPCPEANAPLEPLLADASYAMARAHGCSSCPAGPVHLNIMFREPLSPKPVPWPAGPLRTPRLATWIRSARPFTSYSRPIPGPAAVIDGGITQLVALFSGARRGVVVAGALRTDAERLAVAALSSRLGWPVLPDIGSGLRNDRHTLHDAPIVPLIDLLLAARPLVGLLAPDVVLQVGGRIVGKRLLSLAASARAHIVIEPHGERCDPMHSVTHRVQGAAVALLCALHTRLGQSRLPPNPLLSLCSASRALEKAIERDLANDTLLSELWTCRYICETLSKPTGGAQSILFSSNSGPIRHIDTYCARAPVVHCNRGASGIDGIIHTALGVTAASAGARCTLVIGDLAALHDLSALALVSQQELPLTLVVLNNAGGGIFRSLPVAQYTEVFSPYFDTPHPHRFGLVCEGFGLPYTFATTREGFAAAYDAAQAQKTPSVIEVCAGAAEHIGLAKRLSAIAAEVGAALAL